MSIILYVSFVQNLNGNADGNYSDNQAQARAARAEISKLTGIIIGTDVVVLVLASGAGWLLAGRTLQPIQQMMQVQKKFVANASHDLRTPLAIMKTNTELGLTSITPSNPAYEVLTTNLEEVNNMTQLAEELLWVERSDETNNVKALEPIDIGVLTRRITKKLDNYTNLHSNKFELAITGEHLRVDGSLLNIERALTNILKNALDYSPASSTIKVAIAPVGKSISWSCHNQGKGIKPTDLPYIFNRFYRGSDTISALENHGSGLGLAIAKEIVKQHKGNISAESDLNKGTTITIILPNLQAS